MRLGRGNIQDEAKARINTIQGRISYVSFKEVYRGRYIDLRPDLYSLMNNFILYSFSFGYNSMASRNEPASNSAFRLEIPNPGRRFHIAE